MGDLWIPDTGYLGGGELDLENFPDCPLVVGTVRLVKGVIICNRRRK